MARWTRGVALFVSRDLEGEVSIVQRWVPEKRVLHGWSDLSRRCAGLIVSFDLACKAMSDATVTARTRRIFNPLHRLIGERAVMIRRVVDLGHCAGIGYKPLSGEGVNDGS